ncbi:GNAT family N-acetyltransferase [Sinomonas sp. G460-2]|uniref:GNAT family N-acetyltransferase n=1 Tax=Sinomonas sp. G460-2 TaxID=3393464 RepID=UPI0039EF78F2
MTERPISDDGRWWWDGQRWVPALSPDRRWRFDGRVWRRTSTWRPPSPAVLASAAVWVGALALWGPALVMVLPPVPNVASDPGVEAVLIAVFLVESRCLTQINDSFIARRKMENVEKPRVRSAEPADAAAMARVHVTSWRETYRGLMTDEILDDPDFVPRREQFWNAALSDPRYAYNNAAVAEVDNEVAGIAMAGPVEDAVSDVDTQLYLLYLLSKHHGSGMGKALLDAVLRSDESAALWVADPNPRAQAFYAKSGFQPDGTSKEEGGVREVRMSRPAANLDQSPRPGKQILGHP